MDGETPLCHKKDAQRGLDYKISRQKNKKTKKNIFGKFISLPSPVNCQSHIRKQQFQVNPTHWTWTQFDVPIITSDNDSEGSCVEIVDGGSDTDVCEEIASARFSRILCDAQKKAQVENAAKGSKRKTYSGNSRSNTHRRKRYRGDLAAKGYLWVHEFMKKRMESKKKRGTTFEESEESSDDDMAIASRLWSNGAKSLQGHQTLKNSHLL